MTHLALLVDTNVHNDISVDHIKILTKNREEITLRFIDNDHHKKSKESSRFVQFVVTRIGKQKILLSGNGIVLSVEPIMTEM